MHAFAPIRGTVYVNRMSKHIHISRWSVLDDDDARAQMCYRASSPEHQSTCKDKIVQIGNVRTCGVKEELN